MLVVGVAGAQLGSSKGLRVGQSVFAIGNPRGLSRTLTAGVVSGLNRAIPSPVNTLTYGAIQVRALAALSGLQGIGFRVLWLTSRMMFTCIWIKRRQTYSSRQA
jgi:hypothetical protein